MMEDVMYGVMTQGKYGKIRKRAAGERLKEIERGHRYAAGKIPE